jgi:hypothetical protein
MRKFLALAAAAALLAGCNQAKSPDAVARNVDKVEDKAAAEVAKTEDSAGKSLDKSADRIGDDLVKFNNDSAREAYKVAVTKADGDREVTLAKCQAQSGDAQKMCKDQADADFAAAKANAKAVAESEKQ